MRARSRFRKHIKHDFRLSPAYFTWCLELLARHILHGINFLLFPNLKTFFFSYLFIFRFAFAQSNTYVQYTYF